MGKRMTWLEFAQGWHQAQANDAMKKVAKNTAPGQPQGKYQRLADGTWGYPDTDQGEKPQAAFERGWRQGWEAGYKAAMEQAKAPA
jgi:hypothetical protein